MRLSKLLTLTASAVVLLASVAHAQEKLGLVKAFLVKGDVMLVNEASGQSAPLKRGQEFSEGNVIITGDNSSALLLFSNGSSTNVAPNSKVTITNFEQAAYDTDLGTYLRLEKNPSLAQVQLDMEYGELITEVRDIENVAGSSYVVNTPVASAGIRGSIVGCSYDPTTGAYTVSNVEGAVTVVYQGQSYTIQPGQQMTFGGGQEPTAQDIPQSMQDQAEQFQTQLESAGGFRVNMDVTNGPIFEPDTEIITDDNGNPSVDNTTPTPPPSY